MFLPKPRLPPVTNAILFVAILICFKDSIAQRSAEKLSLSLRNANGCLRNSNYNVWERKMFGAKLVCFLKKLEKWAISSKPSE